MWTNGTIYSSPKGKTNYSIILGLCEPLPKNNGAITTANSHCKNTILRWVENMTPALPVQAKSDLKYPTGFLMAGTGHSNPSWQWQTKHIKKQTSSLILSKSYVSWTWQRSYFVFVIFVYTLQEIHKKYCNCPMAMKTFSSFLAIRLKLVFFHKRLPMFFR